MKMRIDPEPITRRTIDRVPSTLIARAKNLPTATLHEAAGRIGALPGAIKPVAASMRLCGPAITIYCPAGDNLWIHRALYVARPGDILVVNVAGGYEFGYWGEILSTAAIARKLGGFVIDGGVRDADLLETLAFPVFSRGLNIRGTGKDFSAMGWINAPIDIGDVRIEAGDLIVGDRDGVVAIPCRDVETVLAASVEREAKEADVMKRLTAGEPSLAIYGWDQ